MAKKSVIARNKKRNKTVDRYAQKRTALKAIVNDVNASYDERMAAMASLHQLPRNASPTRLRNRCQITGRSRGVMRRFGISRIKLRELFTLGQIPGLEKSSW